MEDLTGSCAKPQRRSIGAKRNPATEEAILGAAQEILRDKGVKGLSMEAVAKRARAGKATLYKWWPSRGALLVAVYERAKGEHVHEDKGTLIATMAAFYRYVFDFWRTAEGQVFALIIAEAQSDADVAEALERYRKERLVALAEVVDRSQARGELIEGAQAEALAETIMAAAWMRLITGRLDSDPERLAHEVLDGWMVGNR
ncbi:TetR family transcriptional regulator [Celeribacter ethanolicus]|uniref:TetR family transcriptional regulator n=1 Tax=Celeribacter ethanolicus TaxID=1758178 RepID=A0A291GI80_9RHOB|nr:TetR family transcriptional regulator [Celeribacter ethanolicus]TNE67484.1 MAG: TetR/AcrR family transcriptional regulator [Paracoccaceae bacterium]